MTIDDNPFERWDLDPGDDMRKLTYSMRQKSAQLSDEERDALQRDWRIITSDPVARARWALLTPPRVSTAESPWSEAENLADVTDAFELPALQPTIDDGLVLPIMADEFVDAAPPFLPRYLVDDAHSGVEPAEDE